MYTCVRNFFKKSTFIVERSFNLSALVSTSLLMAFKSIHLRKREPQFIIFAFFRANLQIAVHSQVSGINEFELFHRTCYDHDKTERQIMNQLDWPNNVWTKPRHSTIVPCALRWNFGQKVKIKEFVCLFLLGKSFISNLHFE